MKYEKIPVIVNLLAVARYGQAPDYPIQLMTKGTLQRQGQRNWALNYQETIPESDDEPEMSADVTLLVTPEGVTMNRAGPVCNTMVFSKGRRFEGVYSTPYGQMDMAVTARDVVCRQGEEKGSIHLKYDLEFQGAYTSTNELHLEYFADPKKRDGGAS